MPDAPVTFPASRIPAQPNDARLLGLYPQRQEGLWMQRVRGPGGELTGKQWAALARIARELTDQPLHLTTRQDVEIHGLTDRTVPRAQQRLAEVGLTGLGGCGDTIRNVVVCPCAGLAPGAPDLAPLAGRLTELLQSHPGAFELPRKFKVSLSACADACALPWIHDVGLVARPQEGGWVFASTVAGSLGAVPNLGVSWGAPLDADDVPAFVLAALQLFAVEGDRENRRRARLRHVRERLGDEEFLRRLDEAFRSIRASESFEPVTLAAPTPGLAHRRRLAIPEGNVSADLAGVLGELASSEEVQVRLGPRHEIFLFAASAESLRAAVDRLPGGVPEGPSVVACPGTRWCSRERVQRVPDNNRVQVGEGEGGGDARRLKREQNGFALAVFKAELSCDVPCRILRIWSRQCKCRHDIILIYGKKRSSNQGVGEQRAAPRGRGLRHMEAVARPSRLDS